MARVVYDVGPRQPPPDGERPVMSGDGATTPDPLSYTNQQRGLLEIGSSNVPAIAPPEQLVGEGLELRSAHPDYDFTDARR